jgi:hypothetical protein
MSMLSAPPADFATLPLASLTIDPSRLFRSSRHATGEPHFGRSGLNRFDDPSPSGADRYSTCYFGFDIATAVAETVLHDEEPVGGRFLVAKADFDSRNLVRLTGRRALKVANMTGAMLKICGGNAALSAVLPYDIPQQWSKAVHDHPGRFDGFQYMSRHLNDRKAVVLFSRHRKPGMACPVVQKLGRSVYQRFDSLAVMSRVRKLLSIELVL